MNLQQIAKTCHEVNKAYCESIGDTSQLPWKEAPQWQRESAINGVIFHLENPEAGPSASHENWMKEKVADGWVYGETKDTEAKTHPCMVNYNQLPAEQQTKDSLFISVVHSFTNSVVDVLDLEIDELLNKVIDDNVAVYMADQNLKGLKEGEATRIETTVREFCQHSVELYKTKQEECSELTEMIRRHYQA